MQATDRHDEESLGWLLRLLPPAPSAWVAAAQRLPEVKEALANIQGSLERDAAAPAGNLASLEDALLAAGYEPEPALLRALQRRLRAACED
jgi:hypothetical protein